MMVVPHRVATVKLAQQLVQHQVHLVLQTVPQVQLHLAHLIQALQTLLQLQQAHLIRQVM